mmetsp:Transcript_68653/g.200930  ORF Transcript_68653/g.200930 Transcript_68653/m.200930 type:complete len:351 (-) Transcript_68653:253-1305(-)
MSALLQVAGHDAASSWATFLSSSALLVMTISLLLPAAIAAAMLCEQRRTKEQCGSSEEVETRPSSPGRSPSRKRTGSSPASSFDDAEPWRRQLDAKGWQQAGQLEGCPWSFDGCDDVQDAMERIWRRPLARDLHSTFEVLKASVQNIQVARFQASDFDEAVFVAVYALRGGAELFGGAPLEHTVGVELFGEESCEPGRGTSPVRRPSSPTRRRWGECSPRSSVSEPSDLPLPCLSPFYRIHDGFGVLLSIDDLPRLLSNPGDSVDGSCFYVYPVRGFEPVAPHRSLVKFARVDRHCVACANCLAEDPRVVYVERTGDHFEDEETPLAFVADTISNVAGRGKVANLEHGRS